MVSRSNEIQPRVTSGSEMTEDLSGKKILYVHHAIRTYREPLFRRLGEQGVHFLFTTINPPGSHTAEETARILKDFPYPYRQAREIQWFPFSNFSLDLLRTLKYDIVIFTTVTSVPFWMCAGLLKLLGKKVILFDETWRYQHEVGRYKKMYPYLRHLVRKRTDAFVPAGSKQKEMYLTDFGVPEECTFVAYDTTVDLMEAPRDATKEQAVRAKIAEKAKGRRVILYLGRLVKYKGLDVLIEAMQQVPEDACLIVVGTGVFQAECENLVASLNLQERVHFLGGCLSDESLYYYLSCAIFVLPTRFLLEDAVNCECWGYTVNEAMSLEVPVVATTAVGAAFDLIRDGETGMVALENDPDSLATKMNWLLEEECRRKEIGKKGRLWLRKICNYEQNFHAYLSALNYVLERK